MGVGGELAVAGEAEFEGRKEFGFAVGVVFAFEAFVDGVEEGEGPVLFEETLRGDGVDRFEGEAGFGVFGVEGDDLAAAAFFAVGFAPFVDEEVVEGFEEEGAEFAAVAGDRGEDFFLEQAREEFLGEVLGVGGGVAAVADVGVEGIPVTLAKFGQGFAGGGGIFFADGNDLGPVSGGEVAVRLGRWFFGRLMAGGHLDSLLVAAGGGF